MEPETLPAPAHQPKIGSPMAFILMAIAILSDLLNWIPGVNIVLAVVTAGFPLYFWFKGIPFSVSLVGDLAEVIPGLSVVPALTASIALTIYADRNPDSWFAKKVTQVTSKLNIKKAGVAAPVAPRIRTPKGALGELAAIE